MSFTGPLNHKLGDHTHVMKQMEVTHFPCASVSSAGVEKSNEILKIHNDKKQQQKHLTKSENKITDVNMK